jgi:hypothetical protein
MRRARAADATGVSLFPCLAVMLSMAGVMIVVLVVMARCAAVDASQSDVSAPAAVISREKRDALARELAQLDEVHRGLENRLNEKRHELGYIENQRRQLEQKGLELHAALEEQRRLVSAGQKQRDEAKADIERLAQAIAETEAALKEIQQNGPGKQLSYAIVPYEGPNHTRRRPIYIECTSDRIILQPEGIVLAEEDFEGPLDSGNPLAAALRATREYLDQQRMLAGDDPYPLVLIRPDGVPAYYVVRQAISDWGAEFGYELVEQDWKLKFPPADPTLAQIQARVVEESRQRQRLLAARAKRDVVKRKTYVVAPSGGIVQDRAGAGIGSPAVPYDPDAESRDADARSGGHGGSPRSGQGHRHSHVTGKSPGSHSAGVGKYRERTPDGNGNLAQAAAKQLPRGNKGASGPIASPTDSAAGGNAARDAGQEVADSEPRIGESRLDEPKLESRPAPANDITPFNTNDAGGAHANPDARVSAGMHRARMEPNEAPDPSLAKSRGKNWGLKHVARGSIPITRPVRVLCFEDRALVAPIDDTYQPKVIPFAAQTRDSVDPLVAAVWEQTRQWGIAGKGMYWRPVLSFDVQPGGQQRFDELRTLLDDSGLVVRRKGETESQANPQQVQRPGTELPR